MIKKPDLLLEIGYSVLMGRSSIPNHRQGTVLAESAEKEIVNTMLPNLNPLYACQS